MQNFNPEFGKRTNEKLQEIWRTQTCSETEIAKVIADDLQEKLDRHLESAGRLDITRPQLSGIFTERADGTITLKRPIPFEPK